jgi:hypothetical protein
MKRQKGIAEIHTVSMVKGGRRTGVTAIATIDQREDLLV